MRRLLTLALVAIAASAQTSGSISGRVLDASGASVPQARVTATSADAAGRWTAITNVEGRYVLPSLRSGSWLVEAVAEGFGSSAPRAVRLEGSPATVDLTLDLARLVSQVQVTAAAVAQSVDEQSKALTIVDSIQLDRRAEYSVADALRTVPGLRVQQLGGPGSFTRVVMRGMRPTDTSMLIDGFRLRDAASPQGDASAFVGDLLLTSTDR
ncbi:MAG TPA: carboxypeptidase regulatory-like domain-containing protein, partial [Bryobacteraceae bacterium]|nr:carboxypeptidase regulatory-like domain-containing protein [Bryobacteraceae bacterium]